MGGFLLYILVYMKVFTAFGVNSGDSYCFTAVTRMGASHNDGVYVISAAS